MNDSITAALIIFFLFVFPYLIILIQYLKNKKLKRQQNSTAVEIQKQQDALIDYEHQLQHQLQQQQQTANEEIQRKQNIIDSYEERFKPVIDADNMAEGILRDARTALKEASDTLNQAQQKANKTQADADTKYMAIIQKAKSEALLIAGDALITKEKASQYEAAIKAMRNTIEGYKDDYIIPNHSVLDDLAENFSYKEAGEALKEARKKVRDMIKSGQAGECDYAEANRRGYAIHFAVDAFNGKVDSALAKVKHDNFGKIKQELLDAYALVNHNGSGFRNARIQPDFLAARMDELKWAVATYELKQQEMEEQRAIREQMREEEKAQRDMEKAIKDAEKEERLLQQALEKAHKELASASAEQRQKFEDQLAQLQQQLVDAEARGQRAISMAQQTKQGHVYIISNIGSFGEDVFKIGMTRRLEPLDRVKELGDASVPFEFDVHAMIHSLDAPALEKELHRRFEVEQINKVNQRKEFFRLPLAMIRQTIEQQGIQEIHWTMKAEATEYRESLAITQLASKAG